MKITFVVPAALVIFTGLVLLQIFLSKKDNKWLGLILPIICFCVALAGSGYQIYEWSAAAYGNTTAGVFGWVDSTFVAVSETIPNENNKNGFNITLKVNQTKKEALLQYKNLLKNGSTFEINGVSTITGDRSGYEYSVMIMDNTLGGSERTMIQKA